MNANFWAGFEKRAGGSDYYHTDGKHHYHSGSSWRDYGTPEAAAEGLRKEHAAGSNTSYRFGLDKPRRYDPAKHDEHLQDIKRQWGSGLFSREWQNKLTSPEEIATAKASIEKQKAAEQEYKRRRSPVGYMRKLLGGGR